jgi:D-3-phosphoglycerate dehydrogenase
VGVTGHPVRIFLTHPLEARANWYGERALSGLRAVAEVVLNPKDRVLSLPELAGAAPGCAIIIADRQTPGEAALFERLPDLVTFVRVGVDIRNVDVAAASAAGVLVTQASRGFMAAVAEWIIGAMIAACRNTIS